MDRSPIPKAMAAAGAAAILVAFPALAPAANLNAVPSLGLEGKWDSNIFNTSAAEEDDYIFRAKPGVTLFIEAFQTTAKLAGGFEIERYADHDELDDETATTNVDLTVSEPFRVTPRFSFQPSASYIETRDSTRRNQLSPAPSPGVPPAETVVTARIKSRDYRAALRLIYLLSPRIDVAAGGGWSRRDFVGDATGDSEDSRTVSGDLDISYRVTPRFSSGVFFNTGSNAFETSPDSRTFSGGLSGNYRITEHYTLSARAGATFVKEDAGVSTPENEEWSPSGNISLSYTWHYFQAMLQGSYELAGGGSFGRTTRRGTAVLTLKNQFAERWWWDLAGSFQTNRSIDDLSTQDIYTTEGSAGIRYTATEWASFRLSGDILRQRSDGLEGDDLDGESVFLGIYLSTFYRVY